MFKNYIYREEVKTVAWIPWLAENLEKIAYPLKTFDSVFKNGEGQ